MAMPHRSISRSVFLGFVLSILFSQSSVYSACPPSITEPEGEKLVVETSPSVMEITPERHVTFSNTSTPSTIGFSPFLSPSLMNDSRSRSNSAISPRVRSYSNASTSTFTAALNMSTSGSPLALAPENDNMPTTREIYSAIHRNNFDILGRLGPRAAFMDLDGRGRTVIVLALAWGRYEMARRLIDAALADMKPIEAGKVGQFFYAAVNSQKAEAIKMVTDAIHSIPGLKAADYFKSSYVAACLQIKAYDMVKTIVEYVQFPVSYGVWKEMLAHPDFEIDQAVIEALNFTETHPKADFEAAALEAGRPEFSAL